MDGTLINVLLTTFAGLGLPRTLSLPLHPSTPISDALDRISDRLPRDDLQLSITTTSNRLLSHSSKQPISTLASSENDTFLALRLSAKLCGGKGGFGSQLRAAGGRMSSRKKRNQPNEPQNGSNRNLDGRRLRTVYDAKKVAAHLAKEAETAATEQQERRKKLEGDVEKFENQTEVILSGKSGAGQGRLDAGFVESKQLAEERTREAVVRAMRENAMALERTGSESSIEAVSDASEGGQASASRSQSSSEEDDVSTGRHSAPVLFGFDDEEDDEDGDESGHDGGSGQST